jgi:NTE family protein
MPNSPAAQKIANDVFIDLALQGGGAHGAFTWGVLDRLLEEPKLRIEGISGTSAGAMNAAVLADGYTDGSAEGARRALEAFWSDVARSARFSPFQRGPLDRMLGRWTLDQSPNGRAFPARHATSSTASTRSPSMRCCSRNSA